MTSKQKDYKCSEPHSDCECGNCGHCYNGGSASCYKERLHRGNEFYNYMSLLKKEVKKRGENRRSLKNDIIWTKYYDTLIEKICRKNDINTTNLFY